jgi:hypothetical protein
LSDERPEALLRSALEKIVYFEARAEQLSNDVAAATAEVEQLKCELGRAGQREIELRRHVAGLEVEASRAHREREELGRMNDALRAERAALIGKLIEASRIHTADRPEEADATFDLASFIAELRGAALAQGSGQAIPPADANAVAVPAPAPALAAAGGGGSGSARAPAPSVAAHAQRLMAEGRLRVSEEEMASLTGAQGFGGRTEETLFGFSVRELSAPDPQARVRAAERLRALGNRAAAPPLATALHTEREPSVLVALLAAFAELAHGEGAQVVAPLVAQGAPEVRVAALKALLKLEPGQAGPQLSQALKDPDRAVRRRASLLALGLSGDAALKVGEEAIGDSEPDVRATAALVLGASGDERARQPLLAALRDRAEKVRRAAAQSLSRLLGQDVSWVVSLDEATRRREVRRLAELPVRPFRAVAEDLPVERSAQPASPSASTEPSPVLHAKVAQRSAGVTAPVGGTRARVIAPAARALAATAVLERAVAPTVSAATQQTVLAEVRCAIRGRTVEELTRLCGQPAGQVVGACEALASRGQVVRRGSKYFAA